MKTRLKDPFEISILKVVTIVGLVRFIIALAINDTAIDGYPDLYLDISSTIVFILAIILLYLQAGHKCIIALFYIPVIVLLWLSFYFHKGLASSTEVNAFALVVIICLTMRDRLLVIFNCILIAGVLLSLFIVEQQNKFYSDFSNYSENTFTLLFVSLAIVLLTYYAKNTFDHKRIELEATNISLEASSAKTQLRNEQLEAQNNELERLKNNLEEKVLERTHRLQQQKESIEEYLKLTLIELMKPYEKTLKAINKLKNTDNNKLNEMIIDSGNRLEVEVEKLKTRLTSANE